MALTFSSVGQKAIYVNKNTGRPPAANGEIKNGKLPDGYAATFSWMFFGKEVAVWR